MLSLIKFNSSVSTGARAAISPAAVQDLKELSDFQFIIFLVPTVTSAVQLPPTAPTWCWVLCTGSWCIAEMHPFRDD